MGMSIGSEYSTSPLSSPLPLSSPQSSPPSSQTSLRSSPEHCLTQTSSPTPSSSSSSQRSTSPRITKRRERRTKQSEVTVYGLRPRDRETPSLTKRESTSSLALIEDNTSSSQSNPSSSLGTNHTQTSRGSKAGRLQKWQLDILQNAFDNGIWSPGDATVEVLTRSLTNRTDKQIRDWFSHRRRKLREAGISDKRSGPEEDVVEALFLLGQGDQTQYIES